MAHVSGLRSTLIALAVFACALVQPAVAAETPPIHVYWADASGVQSDRVAQHWGPRLDKAMHASPDGPTLETGVQDALTALPSLALASQGAAAHLGAPWVLVVEVGPDDAPTIHARLVDVDHRDWSYECSGLHVTEDGWASLSTFVRQSLEEASEDTSLAVSGVAATETYHRTDATHVTSGTVAYKSPAEARAAGLHACPICFPATATAGADPSEIALSDDVSRMMVAHYTISDDKKSLERVDRVGHRLLEGNHIHDFTYTFNILESREVNAFSAGAGHVFITSRLLGMLETDDELAAVLGHEIGHCECHHVLRTYRQHQAVSLVGVMLSMATGSSMGSFVSDFLGSLFTRGFGRNFELEADYRGLLYAHVAGYHADAFITALKKLEQTGGHGSASPEWLNTHPSAENRIQEIRTELAQVEDFDRQAAALTSVDASLAEELRSGVARYLRQGDKVHAFLSARQGLTASAPSPPAPPPLTSQHD